MTSVLVYIALFGMAALLVFVASDALLYIAKTSIRKARATYRRMGRTRFLAAAALWMIWGVVYVYLTEHTGWRNTFAAHDVTRGAYLGVLVESPSLLKEGTLASDTLFVWIWVLFPAVVVFSLWHVPRKLSKVARRSEH